MKPRPGVRRRSGAPRAQPALPIASLACGAALLAALLACGCNSNSLTATAPSNTGDCADLQPGATLRYAYTAYDADGKAVLEGVLTLAFTAGPPDDPSRLADVWGDWTIRVLLDDPDVGPQVGSGSLSGFVGRAGAIQLDLNPQMADNNVFLSGQAQPCAALAFAGDWVHSTIVGPRVGGSFRAERLP